MALNYVKFSFDHGFTVDDDDNFTKLKLPHNKVKNSPYKVLYVLDFVPRNDLRDVKGHLLSDGLQETFDNLLNYAGVPKHNYLVCAFHSCRTINKSEGFVASAYDAFERRLYDIIESYKPDKIVAFGLRPFQVLCPKEVDMTNGKPHSLTGIPIKKSITFDGKKTPVTITKSLAIDTLLCGDEDALYMSGYIARTLRNAHFGKLEYEIKRPELNVVLIDSIKRFKKFFKLLCSEPLVCIDTETDNLYKVKNRVLTIQFSFDTETSYIIPLCHKDSPFDPEELQYIFEKLKFYFEHVKIKTGMIFVNAQFDLAVMKTQFKILHYCSNVIDVLANEYILDENLKLFRTFTGDWYYSLGNLAVQYGDFSYMQAKFGKSDRATISQVDLSEDVLKYCGYDSVIPFALFELQVQRAKDMNYKKFYSMATLQMSDVMHSLAILEYNGYLLDIEYLFKLKLPDSPINKEIDRLLNDFYACETITQVNKRLLKESGVKSGTLFGTEEAFVFKVNKADHLQKLFFDVLKLKVVKTGVNGKGKIDKVFQKEHEEVKEIKLYTAFKKATKLRDAYVNQILGFWSENDDFKNDKRIRCKFDYLPVVTGRVSASKPGMQQIPSRSELGKHIKRLFISGRGKFIVKVDYRAHEVRGWGIISGDSAVAKAFKVGQDLIKKYKRNPSEELLKHIGLEGDVHKVNSSLFFSKKIEDVSKEDRNDIKGIVFGLIYGKGVKTLAADIKRELEYTEQLVEKFMKRFKKGGAWFPDIEGFAQKNFFVESPIGRRRNLYGYLLSAKDKKTYSGVKSAMDRRAKNSPVQGFGSDCMMIGIRSFCNNVWEYYLKHGYYPYMKPCVSVHDSLEVECDFEHLLLTINYVEKSLTDDVKRIIKERHNFELNSDLEIDFELGVCTDKLTGWYGDLDQLEEIAYKGIKRQSEELKYNYTKKEVKKMMESIFKVEYMNDWMIFQAENHKPRFLEYKFDEERFHE